MKLFQLDGLFVFEAKRNTGLLSNKNVVIYYSIIPIISRLYQRLDNGISSTCIVQNTEFGKLKHMLCSDYLILFDTCDYSIRHILLMPLNQLN